MIKRPLADANLRSTLLKDLRRPATCTRHEHCVSGMRKSVTNAAVALSSGISNESVSGAPPQILDAAETVGDADVFSTQALVADYQYALRYYRALKCQVGAWRSAFASTHGRQPTVEEAAGHGGRQFALLYSSFLEVRSRLLAELPRLRTRMLPGQDMEMGGQHSRQSGPAGSVNANSSSSGVVGGVRQGGLGALPPHLESEVLQSQVVDSVATWLRADRYRRQRAVAVAEAMDSVLSYSATVAKATEPQSQCMPFTVSREGEEETTSLVAMASAAMAAGPYRDGPTGMAPYQPVIQLTPISQRSPGLAAGMHQQGQGQGQRTQGSGDVLSMSASAGSIEGARFGHPSLGEGQLHLAAVAAASLQPARSGLASLQAPVHGGGVRLEQQQLQQRYHTAVPVGTGAGDSDGGGNRAGMHLPSTSPEHSAAVRPHTGVPNQTRHAERLAEDAGLAADSRAKNALLAALQYKRTGRTAASAQPESTGTLECGQEGLSGSAPRGVLPPADSGEAAAAAQDAGSGAVVVVGKVHRGDAIGAYAGRNRRTEALPEVFLVCP